MARIRRPKKITGGEYTFGGGGGGASGDIVRFMRYSDNAVENGGTGVLYDAGTQAVFKPIKVTLEAGLSVDNTAQTNSRVYWDHAFEAPVNVDAILVTEADELPSGVGSTVPTGLSVNNNTDSTNTDTGNIYFSGTVNSAVEAGTYKFRYRVSQNGWTVNYIDYEVEIWPQGTTPTFSSTNFSASRIIRNTADKQYITPTVTASQAVGYYITANSGFPAGVTPKIETDGRVYVENVGDIEVSAQAHTVTIRVDLGPYGVVDQEMTGDIGYGDPYGARYWGPANARQNVNNNLGPLTMAQSDEYHNHAKASGALRRYTNARQDTSPYLQNDGYGCEFHNRHYQRISNSYANTVSGYSKFGYMGPNGTDTNYWTSSSNYRVVRYHWEVPAGVTSICAVCVGGGSGGAWNWSSDGAGGAGLAWGNGITVTPGEILEIGVGLGRYSESNVSSYGGGPSWIGRYTQGGSGATILFAQGGGYTGYTNNNPNGQSFNGYTISGITNWNRGNSYNFNDSRDAGGWGYNSNEVNAVNGFTAGGGHGQRDDGSRIGGGAGGYRGNNNSHGNDQQGQYGGGGSGYNYSSTHGQGGGGGVGLDGQGWQGPHTSGNPRQNTQAGSGYNGSGGSWTSYSNGSANIYGAGGGGSGGSRANYGQSQYTSYEVNGHRTRCGGLHGGGGGGSGTSNGGGNGAPGGVRVIWGTGENGDARSFPYTYCSEKPSMRYNGES